MNRSENSVVAECKNFMQDVEIASKMDKCLSRLIIAILDYNDAKNEDEFALAVISALKEVFQQKKAPCWSALNSFLYYYRVSI